MAIASGRGGGVVAAPDEIARIARSAGVPTNLISGVGPVRTVVEASDEADRSLAEVGNTVLVTVDDRPVVVIVPGDRRIDGAAVGRHYAAQPLQVSLATQSEAREYTGYDLGMIPPVDHARDCDVLVDERLLEHETVLLPSGDADALLEVNPRGLARLDHAETGDWSQAIDDE
jgi:prolyl-tRNA editing enzyme YbaK/EbsC (Cys-tRNA(Pro) deacylase)